MYNSGLPTRHSTQAQRFLHSQQQWFGYVVIVLNPLRTLMEFFVVLAELGVQAKRNECMVIKTY